MKVLLSTLGAVFLTTFLAAPTMGAGWFWDTGNGFGFAAFAGLLYLGFTSYRRLDVRAHRLLGYTVLSIAVVHALWFLLGDAAVVEFIKIGTPDYMWLGIIGLLLLFVLVTIARVPDRFSVHRNHQQFHYWHRALAVITVASCTYHIIVSHFYLVTWYQVALFVAVASTTSFRRSWWIRFGEIPTATATTFLVGVVVFTGLFSIIRNFQF